MNGDADDAAGADDDGALEPTPTPPLADPRVALKLAEHAREVLRLAPELLGDVAAIPCDPIRRRCEAATLRAVEGAGRYLARLFRAAAP